MRSPSLALKTPLSGVNWRFLGAELVVGLVFFIFNFRGFVEYATNHWAPEWLANPTLLLLRFTEKALAFTGSGTAWSPLLSEWLVVGLWWYLAILVITSFVYMKPGRLANGLSGLCVGFGSIVFLSWTGVVLVKIASIIGAIFAFIFSIIGAVFRLISALVIVVFPYLAGLALVIGVVYALVQLARTLGLTLMKYALVAAAAVAVMWLALPLLRWCYASLLLPILHFLSPIVAWLFAALGVILMCVLVIIAVLGVAGVLVFVLGMLGRLAIDQFRTAWEGGRGERPITLAGFSVGSAFALLLTVTAGLPDVAAGIDAAWHEHAWMLNTWSPAASHFQALPDAVAGAFAAMFQYASAPVFDGVVLVALLTTAAVGAMRRWKAEEDVWEARYISGDALKVGVALGLGLLVLVVAANLPNDS
jgi:hypothetical protein